MVSIDLSKASKLKYLEFVLADPSVQWITMTLRTVKSKNLQFIGINPYDDGPQIISEADHQEWQVLDHLLVQFWTSHSIRPWVMYMEEDLKDRVPSLLPELTRRGLVDLVHCWDRNGEYDYFFSMRVIPGVDHICVWTAEGV